MECPVCFSSDRGAYLFTECGHSACPECIIRMHETTNALKCPMCRVAINRAPVIVQAFASHMPDGLVHTMAQNFKIWFGQPQKQLQNNTETLNDSYPAHQVVSEIVNGMEDILNAIEGFIPNNNPRHNMNSTIANNEVKLNDAAEEEWNIITPENKNAQLEITNIVHNLPNNWIFIPFNKYVKINIRTEFGERWNYNSRTKFRRVIIYLNELELRDKILETEYLVFSSLRNPDLVPYSEIGTRNNRLSICAHALTYDSYKNEQNFIKNLTLICCGVWKHEGRVGCRWFVTGLY